MVLLAKGGIGFAFDEFTESPVTETQPTAQQSSRGEGSFVRGSYACTISYYSESPWVSRKDRDTGEVESVVEVAVFVPGRWSSGRSST